MRREPVPGPMARWQPWRWTLADVQVLQGPHELTCAVWPTLAGRGPVALEPCDAPASAAQSHWGFPGYVVSLHPEDAEGLYLNLTAPQPCFWVMWRSGETDDDLPEPQIVTLSYHDAGRWLDAQERVDQVPAPADVIGLDGAVRAAALPARAQTPGQTGEFSAADGSVWAARAHQHRARPAREEGT
jgi:hypothetical protein